MFHRNREKESYVASWKLSSWMNNDIGFRKFSFFLLTNPRWPSDDLLVCGDVNDDAYVELECFREFPEISLYSTRTMGSS